MGSSRAVNLSPVSSIDRSFPQQLRAFTAGLLGTALLGSVAPELRAAESLSMMNTAASARPVEALEQGPRLQKVGEATLKVMLWSVYDSRLFTADGQYQEGQRPLRLEIEYLLDIKRDALVKRTQDEWEAMGRDHPEQESWLQQLTELWPNITKNDVLTLVLDAENVATFYRNGERLGSISDPAFGQHFVDIWLSPDCTRPELRLALLGED